jgi:transcription elongation factor Elf1
MSTRGEEAPPTLTATITCPHCGHRESETMPVDACLFFYECTACATRLKPKPGDCCVFCSYGSAKCPPKQSECCS